MHIAFISLHTSPLETPGTRDAGGMNVVLIEQAKALTSLGHRVTIFTRASLTQAAGVVMSEVDPHLKIVALQAGPADLNKHELPAIIAEFAAKVAAFASDLDDPIDVWHAHYWLSGEVLLELQRISEKIALAPAFITLHTVAAQKNALLAPGDSPESQTRLQAEKALTQTLRVIAMSNSELQSITQFYGSAHIYNNTAAREVIAPGVDTNLFQPAQAKQHDNQHGKQQSELRLVTLGRVQPLKGQDLSLAAFAKFQEMHPHLNATLTIAGEATPGAENYAAQLRQAAARLAPGSVIFLPGQNRAQAAQLLAASDIAIVPSHSETFGLVALEAAASGTPVIAADVSGLRESVKRGVSGSLVAGRDPHIWAQEIAALAHDRARLADQAASAREFALAHDWTVHAKKLLAFYLS